MSRLVRGLYEAPHEEVGDGPSVDDLAFRGDDHGALVRGADGKERIDEAMFRASTAEARGLRGFRGV